MTILEQIKNSTQDLIKLLEVFLLEHSNLSFLNPPDSGIFDLAGDHSWNKLDQEGKQLQSKLREKYSIYYSILKEILKNQPQVSPESLEASNDIINTAIEQNKNTWDKNPQEVYGRICYAFATMFQQAENLFSFTNKVLLIPDTNALLNNPNIEAWKFFEFPCFSIILTPTVLSVLDYHRINNKNENLKNRSVTLINKIKEYRKRGRLVDGVPVANNGNYLQTLALEPKVDESLPWFDESNKDDRLLASILEIMRQNSKSRVFLVTSDINLQNKAEYSMIPFIEPPEL